MTISSFECQIWITALNHNFLPLYVTAWSYISIFFVNFFDFLAKMSPLDSRVSILLCRRDVCISTFALTSLLCSPSMCTNILCQIRAYAILWSKIKMSKFWNLSFTFPIVKSLFMVGGIMYSMKKVVLFCWKGTWEHDLVSKNHKDICL